MATTPNNASAATMAITAMSYSLLNLTLLNLRELASDIEHEFLLDVPKIEQCLIFRIPS